MNQNKLINSDKKNLSTECIGLNMIILILEEYSKSFEINKGMIKKLGQ